MSYEINLLAINATCCTQTKDTMVMLCLLIINHVLREKVTEPIAFLSQSTTENLISKTN